MTVQIADLVARVRADTTDFNRGIQETGQALKSIEQQAGVTGRAFEIMAAQFAKLHGGTAADALSMFQRSGAQPTATAMAEAAKQMEATGAAATKAVEPTRAAARAVAEHATSARRAAEAHDDITTSARMSETSIVRFAAALTGVNVGLSIAAGAGRLLHENIAASLDAAINFDRVSRGLVGAYGAGAPQAAAFAQQFAPQAGVTGATVGRALTAASPLTQYGLSSAQTQQLTARAADIAGRFGQPFDKVFSDVLGAVSTGGNQLEQYGLKVDDARLKTDAYGGALSATFDRMTASQQIGVRFNLFLEQTRSLQGSAATAAATLSGAYDRLGTSLDRLRERSGVLAAGGLQGPADALATAVNSITGTGTSGDRRAIVGDPNAPGGARIIGGPPQFDIGGILARSGIPGGGGPPAFVGPVPLRGADLLAAQAGNAQEFAGRAAAEAQAQITALQLQSEQRRLGAAEVLAGYQRTELQVQGQIAPLMERQATLQDRITLASRDNLESRRALVQAEQAAQGPQNALSELQFGDQRVQLLAQVRQMRQFRGQDVSDLPSLNDLINQHVGFQLDQPEVALRALDTGHAVDVVQRQRTGEDLGRQLASTPMEAQRRALEGQTIPLQEQLRLTQAREASVQRALELTDLGNTNTLVAAQFALNEANGVRLIADETARLASSFSDNMASGATALERSASAIDAARDALSETIPIVQQLDLKGRQGPASVTIQFNGALTVRSDQDVDDIANKAAALVMSGLAAGDDSGPPAPSTLPGARR